MLLIIAKISAPSQWNVYEQSITTFLDVAPVRDALAQLRLRNAPSAVINVLQVLYDYFVRTRFDMETELSAGIARLSSKPPELHPLPGPMGKL